MVVWTIPSPGSVIVSTKRLGRVVCTEKRESLGGAWVRQDKDMDMAAIAEKMRVVLVLKPDQMTRTVRRNQPGDLFAILSDQPIG